MLHCYFRVGQSWNISLMCNSTSRSTNCNHAQFQVWPMHRTDRTSRSTSRCRARERKNTNHGEAWLLQLVAGKSPTGNRRQNDVCVTEFRQWNHSNHELISSGLQGLWVQRINTASITRKQYISLFNYRLANRWAAQFALAPNPKVVLGREVFAFYLAWCFSSWTSN